MLATSIAYGSAAFCLVFGVGCVGAIVAGKVKPEDSRAYTVIGPTLVLLAWLIAWLAGI